MRARQLAVAASVAGVVAEDGAGFVRTQERVVVTASHALIGAASEALASRAALLRLRAARLRHVVARGGLAVRLRQEAVEDVAEDRVNVKAKTGEKVGPIGRQEAIDADAVVLLGRSTANA